MNIEQIPVVIIGLPRRTDRRSELEATLNQIPSVRPVFAADLGIVEDWRNWTAEQIEDLRRRAFPWCDTTSTDRWWSRHLKLGEIACTLSHWNVWVFAAAQGWEAVIVLEDDAIVGPGFGDHVARLTRLASEDPAWDLLYLGRKPLEPNRARWGSFVIPGYSFLAHAYVLSRRGLVKLLNTELANSIIPVDEFLPALYMPHPRADVRQRFRPALAAYALPGNPVKQQPKKRYGSDTEASPFLVPVSAD